MVVMGDFIVFITIILVGVCSYFFLTLTWKKSGWKPVTKYILIGLWFVIIFVFGMLMFGYIVGALSPPGCGGIENLGK